MYSMWTRTFGLAVALFFPSLVLCKITDKAFYADNEQFQLIDKFCFDASGGTLNITVTPNPDYPEQVIALYHDVAEVGFEGVYQSKASCDSKLELAAKISSTTNGTIARVGGKTWKVKNAQPRWWYAVLANCKYDPEKEGVGLSEYKITWLNGGNGGTTQIGVNDQGLLEMCIFSGITLTLCMFGIIYLYRSTITSVEGGLAPIAAGKLFIICFLHLGTIILYGIYYLDLQRDGKGVPFLFSSAIVGDAVVQILLVTLFFCFSRGLYVSGSELSSYRELYEIIGLYTLCTVCLLWYEFSVYDPVLMYTPYQSTPGIITVLFRVFFAVYFFLMVVRSKNQETDYSKKSVYTQLSIVGVAWFLTFPLITVISAGLMTYNRFKVVFIVEQLVSLLTYIVIGVIYWNVRRTLTTKGSGMDKYSVAGHQDYDDRASENISNI